MDFDPIVLIALLIVITIHESAHALTAYLLGDPTAKLEGRISLNPLRHLDPLGTLLMIFVHIGWGKPVPVNPYNFKKPIRDEALTALAGPVSNLILALIMALPIRYLGLYLPQALASFLISVLDVSIVLFAFNMLPFPPLDGSKFIQLLIPKKFQYRYQQYLANGTGYFMLFVAFDQFILSRIIGFSIIGQFIGIIFVAIKSIIFLGL